MQPQISHDFGQRCKADSPSSHLLYFNPIQDGGQRDQPDQFCPQKSGSYKIEFMITSLLEMLEFSNLGHMTHVQSNLSHVIKLYW